MFQVSESKQGATQEFCSQVWRFVLLRGIAVLALGGLLIAKPGLTAVVLVQFMGAYFLVDGGFAVIKSIMGRKYVQGWVWGVLMGAVEVLTGIFIFGHPIAGTIITAKVLVYTVAFLAIVFGLLGIFSGFQMLRAINDRVATLGSVAVAMIAAGVLAIIFGVILIMNPQASATIYLTVMGAIALIVGLVQIIAAFRIRQVGKQGIESSTT
jgi:uncharacterized membrane protein HdeD (DUF308 family)